MQTQTGSCPHCGAPIYAESPWFGVTPPPPIYTCSCMAHLRMTYTTTDTTMTRKLDKELRELEEV